jgi:hypothetical protein
MPDNYAEQGLRLLNLGFEPVPLTPGTKAPSISDWSKIELTHDRVSGWAANGRADHGVGLRTGKLVALDLDIEDPDLVQAMVEYCHEHIGPSPRRTGRAPRAMLMYRCTQPMTKRTSAEFADWTGDHKLEVLGAGQQVVAFGIHPTTLQPYHWDEPLPALDQLTEITPEQVQGAIAQFEKLATAAKMDRRGSGTAPREHTDNHNRDEDEWFLANHKGPLNLTDERVKETLSQLDPDMGRAPWIDIGMALHHQYAGSEDGYQLWCDWSRASDKYDEEKTRASWDSFSPDPDNPVTFRSVIGMANQVQAAQVADIEALMQPPAKGDTRHLLRMFAWDDVTEQTTPPHQVVEELLVRGTLSLVSAQPNTGKSALILDLAAHVARGEAWRGLEVEQGGVLYVAAESPESIRARILAMRGETHWDHADLMVVQGQGDDVSSVALATPAGRAAFAQGVMAYLEDNPNTTMLVLDTFRNATPGLEENDARDMGLVIQFLAVLARRTGLHIIVVHHTTKSGTSYAGSGSFGAIVDTEIRIEAGVKEMEGLICAKVVQQRSLTSRGMEYWYRIVGRKTGRTTNFGKPETAPLVEHIDDEQLRFMRTERVEAEKEEKKSHLEIYAQLFADATNHHGKTNQVTRVEYINANLPLGVPEMKNKNLPAQVAAIAAEKGWVLQKGEGNGTTYHPVAPTVDQNEAENGG